MAKGKEGPPPEMQQVKNWLALQAIDNHVDAVRDQYRGDVAAQAAVTDVLASLRLGLEDESRALEMTRRGILGRLFRRSSPVEDTLIKEYTLFQRGQAAQAQLTAQTEAADAKQREEASARERKKREDEERAKEELERERKHILGQEESITDGCGWRIFAPVPGIQFQEKLGTTQRVPNENQSELTAGPLHDKALLTLPGEQGETMITAAGLPGWNPRRKLIEIHVRQKEHRRADAAHAERDVFAIQESYFLAPENGTPPDVTYNDRNELVTRENTHGVFSKFVSSIVGFRNVKTDETVYMGFRTENDELRRESLEMTQMEIKPVDKLPDFVPQKD